MDHQTARNLCDTVDAPKPKHYYSDEGILQFDQNDALLAKLEAALSKIALRAGVLHDQDDKTARSVQRAELLTLCEDVVYEYSIHAALGGHGGGCLTPEQWKAKPELSDKGEPLPLKDIFKEMIFDFVEKGFLYNEFLLVGHSAIVQMQMMTMLGQD
jgi:hypothetical protein